MILCLSQMVAVACPPLLRAGVSRRARHQFFIGSRFDDCVKSHEMDGTVIPPWRDRWTFYEAVKFLLKRSSGLTIGDVDIRFIENLRKRGGAKSERAFAGK